MTVHHIEPTEDNLHGYFSSELEPILTIDSGDTVIFKTLDAGWGLEAPRLDRTQRDIVPNHTDERRGHALCGPVAIKGAKAGMVLEVKIGEIITGDYGFTYAGGFDHKIHKALGIDTGEEGFLLWSLDNDTMTATNQYGHHVRMSPFMGVMGMPPPEAGNHPTPPPRIWGGNIDCKELVTGTTLYLPIPVDGALFSTGDGHAQQGDGEVSVLAIECPMERVELTFNVLDEIEFDAPCARIDGAWMTFGFHENLHDASLIALEGMVNLMSKKYQIPRREALALASAVVDLRVTQIANPTVGVHAVLRDDAIW